MFGGGARYLDPEGQVNVLQVVGERLSLPAPRRAQERNNLAKGSVNKCSPGSLPSAGCAAAAAAAAPLMNNAAHQERVE